MTRYRVMGVAAWLLICVHGVLYGQETAPAIGKDQISLKDKTVMVGVNVESETYLEVKVTGKPPVDPTKIDYIRHGDAPPDYVLAESNIRQGQYEDALGRLDKAKGQKARPWLKHYCEYYRAFCLQKLAEAEGKGFEGAIGEYTKLVKTDPKGIWVPQASLGIAECYYGGGNFDKALEELKQIEKSDFPQAWKLKAKIWEGRLQLAQGKADAAADALSGVTKSAGKDMPEIYNEAVLYLAESLTRAKKFPESEDLLSKLVGEADSDRMRAAAHNAFGDCYMAQNKVKEARYEYLRTVVLYFEEAGEYAEALYKSALCFEQLKDVKGAEKLRLKLKKECGDSVWAKKLEAAREPEKKKAG